MYYLMLKLNKCYVMLLATIPYAWPQNLFKVDISIDITGYGCGFDSDCNNFLKDMAVLLSTLNIFEKILNQCHANKLCTLY